MPSLSERNQGQRYWRSLDEWADSPDFRAYLEAEFPHVVPQLISSPTRRQFLKVMGASLAFAGLTGCRWPEETIVPFAKRPQGRTPGVPQHFATALELNGVATGLIVTSADGRPIKVEGNPDHPYSQGATDALAQASVLGLYDPDRLQTPMRGGQGNFEPTTWEEFRVTMQPRFDELRANGGVGLCVFAESSSSPTLADMRRRFQQKFPNAKWFEYEPLSRDNVRQGTRLAAGKPFRPHLNLSSDTPAVIASFDEDFLLTHPASVRYTRDYTRQRTAENHQMHRLYVIESTLSLTGSNADFRYVERSGDLPIRLAQLGAELVRQGAELPAGAAEKLSKFDAGKVQPPFLAKIAEDLLHVGENAAILVGPRQPAEAHALAMLLNQALGSAGKTVQYTPEPDADRPTHLASIRDFANTLQAGGGRQTVLVLSGNPAFNAPADLGIGALLAKHDTYYLAPSVDETASNCAWLLPAAHYLESWGDARAWDGTLTLVQPLIAPLYNGKPPSELLAMFLGEDLTDAHALTRRTFQEQFARDGDFETQWRSALHDGLVAKTAWKRQTPDVSAANWNTILSDLQAGWSPAIDGAFELVFAQDHSLYDGRFANNGWLQECPDPVTKLTWDNAALISPADAAQLGLNRGDEIEIALGRYQLTIPVFLLPGQARGSITLPLGYGRRQGGQVLQGAGFNAYLLRTSEQWHAAQGATVQRARGSYKLVSTQDHHAVASDVGEDETQKRIPMLVREGTLDEYKQQPDFAKHRVHQLPVVQPFGDHHFEGKPRWAMTIDLAKCTGCSACVVACQAENNVPVVGKEEVAMGREMHWLRIDRYFKGEPEQPDVQVAHQPVPCQHCENAPCEQVCPVGATVHDEEGLNVMVYNRCIGTRYCSNNCPYKVRRFNWFYNHHGPEHPRNEDGWSQTKVTPIEQMVFNPEVTVRSRGVMEKCTFCTQRISAVKIEAKNEGRPIADGEITPACAQVCPADAIVFGDLNDEKGRVKQQAEHDRSYAMLDFLNVRPRVRYLAGLRNVPGIPADAHGHGTESHSGPDVAQPPSAGEHGESHDNTNHGAADHEQTG